MSSSSTSSSSHGTSDFRNKQRKREISREDVDYIAWAILRYPGVMACLQELERQLLSLPVSFDKGPKMERDGNFRIAMEEAWTEFARHMFRDTIAYGLFIWRIEEHKLLKQVPVAIDFTTVIVRFTADKDGKRKYSVYRRREADGGSSTAQDSARLRDVYVIEKHAPRLADGALTSPIACLVGRFLMWTDVQLLAAKATRNGVDPTIIVQEPMADSTLSNDQVAGALVSAADASRSAHSARPRPPRGLAADPASAMNMAHSLSGNRSVMERLDSLLTGVQDPVRLTTVGKPLTGEQQRVMIVSDGNSFVSGDGYRVPFIPDTYAATNVLQMEIASVTGVPRAFWAETESRFKTDTAMASSVLTGTVREQGTFLIRSLKAVYNVIYIEEESFHKAMGIQEVQISLPATLNMDAIKQSLQMGIISIDQFKRHAARILGQTYNGVLDSESKNIGTEIASLTGLSPGMLPTHSSSSSSTTTTSSAAKSGSKATGKAMGKAVGKVTGKAANDTGDDEMTEKKTTAPSVGKRKRVGG